MSVKIITARRTQSIINKTVGLIGKKKAENLLFKTRFGIHTFGLRFPIDVLILDKNNRIAQLKQSLQPNKVYFWNPKYDSVLELPEGTIKKLNLKSCKTIQLVIL